MGPCSSPELSQFLNEGGSLQQVQRSPQGSKDETYSVQGKEIYLKRFLKKKDYLRKRKRVPR